MKVAGMKMTNPWASRVLRERGLAWERVIEAPVETVVMMESVTFEHHGPGKNYRPLLHLTGELQSIRPHEVLPHGIDEVTFRAGLAPTVDAFYEFDDAQLAELVSKGYFTEGFEPPSDRMSGIPWELPTTIDALVLAPDREGETPVVFVTIHGQTGLALDAENSGYDLAVYFDNQLTPEAERARTDALKRQDVPVMAGSFEDAFANEDFVIPDGPHMAGSAADPLQSAGTYPPVRASIFEDLMSEFRDVIPVSEPVIADEVAPEPEPAQEPEADPLDSVYRERIAPGVAQALSLGSDAEEPAVIDAAEDAVKAAETDLTTDLFELTSSPADDDDLTVAPISVAPAAEDVWVPEEDGVPAAERTRRRVQRTAAHEQALAEDRLEETGNGPELE